MNKKLLCVFKQLGNNGPIGVEILLKKIIKLGNESYRSTCLLV